MSIFWLILRRMANEICGAFAEFWSVATIPQAGAPPLMKGMKDAECRRGVAGFIRLGLISSFFIVNATFHVQ
jgi:hypothetical protein